MKSKIFLLLSIIGMVLNSASCSTEDMVNASDAEINSIHFDVTIPTGELRTRGYGDGNSISNLKCYVYSVDAELPMLTENVNIISKDGKSGGSLNIDLPSSGAYDFVFLATSCPQDDKDSKIYYNSSERTLNLNYNKIVGNDEEVDCFFGVLSEISISKGRSHSITLKRPYAQLNIGTKDLDAYHKMTSSSLNNVAVSVDGVYTCMNLMDGNCVGNQVKVSFPGEALPSGQTFPVKDATYLAMDYLLVKERKDVNVSLTVNNGKTSFTNDFPDIPLQRNYQTNVYGNLLTQKKDFKVEINPDFWGVENNEINTEPKEYDLIVRLSSSIPISITVKHSDNTIEKINLQKYIDSNKTIKLTWNEIGIANVKSISLYNSAGGNFIQHIDKCNINKIGVTDLSEFAKDCTGLLSVDCIKEWDTSNVEDMKEMFRNCSRLKSLNLSNFDTSKVTDMQYMFDGCSYLENLNLSNFNTANVTNMKYMFAKCGGIQTLDLSNFDTSKVTDMQYMFDGCTNLVNLNLSNFNTPLVTDMKYMFYNCAKLTSLNLSNFNTVNVIDMQHMFDGCSKLKSLNLSNFDTSKVTNMMYMFNTCSDLENLNLSNFNTANVTDMQYMFNDCSKLLSLDLISFNTSKVTNMMFMFYLCKNLANLNLSNFDTSKVTNMMYMFYQCTKLNSLDLKGFNTQMVINMRNMFTSCISLSQLDVSAFKTSNVNNMYQMFDRCSKLKSLDLSNFDTAKVTDMTGMFSNCQSLEELNISNFNL